MKCSREMTIADKRSKEIVHLFTFQLQGED